MVPPAVMDASVTGTGTQRNLMERKYRRVLLRFDDDELLLRVDSIEPAAILGHQPLVIERGTRAAGACAGTRPRSSFGGGEVPAASMIAAQN